MKDEPRWSKMTPLGRSVMENEIERIRKTTAIRLQKMRKANNMYRNGRKLQGNAAWRALEQRRA